MLPCFLKIKCTNEVVDDLNFSDLNTRLVLVWRVNLGDINFIHELPENRGVKLLHIGVLSDRCNKLSDVDFLLLLFLDFLPQMFDKICKVGLFQFIVTGQFDETLVGELAGNVILIQSLDDMGNGTQAYAIAAEQPQRDNPLSPFYGSMPHTALWEAASSSRRSAAFLLP